MTIQHCTKAGSVRGHSSMGITIRMSTSVVRRGKAHPDGRQQLLTESTVAVTRHVRQALERTIERARTLCPDLNLVSLLDAPIDNAQASTSGPSGIKSAHDGSRDLHVSLTHPLPLRREGNQLFSGTDTCNILEDMLISSAFRN